MGENELAVVAIPFEAIARRWEKRMLALYGNRPQHDESQEAHGITTGRAVEQTEIDAEYTARLRAIRAQV